MTKTIADLDPFQNLNVARWGAFDGRPVLGLTDEERALRDAAEAAMSRRCVRWN